MIDTLIDHWQDIAGGWILLLVTVLVWMRTDVEDEPEGDE